MLSDLRKQLETIETKLEELRVSLDIAGKSKQVAELEELTSGEGFWEDPAAAQKVMQKLTGLQNNIREYNLLTETLEEAQMLAELAGEEPESWALGDLRKCVRGLDKKVSDMELAVLLSGPYDKCDAIISLHAGAGGTESQDWVQMLYRMYSRWAEGRGWKVEVIDLLPGDEAGIKSVTMEISGENAYGYLSAEKGVHRLVRISPFDASGRRHTSFASLDVLPEVEGDLTAEIDPNDLRIDTYRASGAGGQHINKTDSAVRITHIPTGVVVQCQNERSQISNRTKAMKLLQARLLDLKLKEQEAELAAVRGEQMDIAWGSQIRSYVFHPYSLVKDHRTNVEIGNVQAVMDGDLDQFVSAYLQKNAAEKV
ncbi:MAG TPA: peptide chain release factor 2 [Bacillota bacterium]|nr:peptide chain release factor 2 [Bacillota bacterium]